MADTKISALTELAAAPADLDELALVDKSDTSMAASGTTKRIKSINLRRGLETVFHAVNDFGTDNTGASDAIPELQDGVDAVFAAGGGDLFLGPGTFSMASAPGLEMKEGVRLRGAGPGSTRLMVDYDFDGSTDEAAIRTTGYSVPSSISTNVIADLTANADPPDTTLTVDDTTGIVAGDYYMLGSDDRVHVGTTIRHGEFVRIESVDSGTGLTLAGTVRGVYTTANSARLYTVSMIEGVEISDLAIVNGFGPGGTTGASFVKLIGVRGFDVNNVLMVDGDSAGIQTQFCMDGNIDVRGRGFTDDVTNGYGVHIQGLNEGIRVNINFRQARHAVTSGTIPSTPGISRQITVSGVASECTTAAFDMHGSGEGWTFSDAHAYNCRNNGFSIRGINARLQNCSTNFCDGGINLTGGGTLGMAGNTNIIGCVIRKTTDRSGSDGKGINIMDGATRTRIVGCIVDGTQRAGINVDGDDVEILNTVVIDPGQNGTATRCINVTNNSSTGLIDNCTFIRHSSASTDVLSSGSVSTEAVLLNTSSTGWVVRRNNRVYGVTALCSNLGTNTVEQLSSAYTVTNGSTDRAYDANNTSIHELADVLGTLLADLKTLNVLP